MVNERRYIGYLKLWYKKKYEKGIIPHIDYEKSSDEAFCITNNKKKIQKLSLLSYEVAYPKSITDY